MTTNTKEIKDLKLDVEGLDRDSIVATLIITHKLKPADARAYYAKYHKGENGDSFVGVFDDFLLLKDRTEKDVIEFLTEFGTPNKLKTKSHFISRAKFGAQLRAKLELQFNPPKEDKKAEKPAKK